MGKKQSEPEETPQDVLEEIIRQVAVYPLEAYEFVQEGLQFTVQRIHEGKGAEESKHVSGQELSLGLRDYAWLKWGLLARTVLKRWNVTSSMDFGKIVYAMIEAGLFSKTPEDSIEDFRNVFDFKILESGYVTPEEVVVGAKKGARA